MIETNQMLDCDMLLVISEWNLSNFGSIWFIVTFGNCHRAVVGESVFPGLMFDGKLHAIGHSSGDAWENSHSG